MKSDRTKSKSKFPLALTLAIISVAAFSFGLGSYVSHASVTLNGSGVAASSTSGNFLELTSSTTTLFGVDNQGNVGANEFYGSTVSATPSPDISFTSAGGLNLNAGGTNQNITLMPSGMGVVNLSLANGIREVSVSPVASNSIQYVSETGNDANDGLSWGTAKATVAGACAALPGGNSSCSAGQGVIYVSPTFTNLAGLSVHPGIVLVQLGTNYCGYNFPGYCFAGSSAFNTTWWMFSPNGKYGIGFDTDANGSPALQVEAGNELDIQTIDSGTKPWLSVSENTLFANAASTNQPANLVLHGWTDSSSTAGGVQIGSAVTFADAVPCSTSTAGTLIRINDSTVNTFGSIISGGGSYAVLAYCDGTHYTVAGI